jgi:hypothetical protein
MAIRGFQDSAGGGERIPVNPINPEGVTRKGVLSRPYVYGLLERFDLEGFEDHETEELSSLLGIPVDPEHPTDYQIGRALQLRAEFEDYCGIEDREAIIRADYEAGLISDAEHDLRLRVLWENERNELASAAVRILVGKTLGQGDFSAGDEECLWELRRWQAGYREETPHLPDLLARQAQHLLDTERRRWRGELPRTRRRSKTDRRRMSTFEVPSFRDQLGRLADLTNPEEIAKAVAELRRQMKDLGLVPSDHDRRTGRVRSR